MAGWPVLIRPWGTGYRDESELVDHAGGWRMIGNTLTFLELIGQGDLIPEGYPFANARVVTIAADGTVRSGVEVPISDDGCCQWTIGPDGVAYGSMRTFGSLVSRITAIDSDGVRAGWPISIDGIASTPSFTVDGQLVLTLAIVGPGSSSSRIVVVNGDGLIADRSAELEITTSVLPPTSDGAYECGVPLPRPPLVAPEGPTYVFGDIDDATYGLDVSLNVLSGWPIAAGYLERPNPWLGLADLDCTSELAIPAAGPGGVVLLPLVAQDPALGGGRIVAIGPDGRVRSGWPVTLTRAGSEFWSVVVGADGTAYALTIEPESGGASSATILAIAPDSTVLYSTTIVDP